MNTPLHILFIGGSNDDFALAKLVLGKAFPDFDAQHATGAAEFAEALVHAEFNTVITENQLGWASGLSLLPALRSRCPHVPIVMFTDSGSEEIAAEAIACGIDVYLPKTPKNFMHLAETISPLLARAGSARSAESTTDSGLQPLLNQAEVGTFRSSLDGHLLGANAAFLRITGIDHLTDTEHLSLQGLDPHPGDWADRIRRLKIEGRLREEAVALRRVGGPTLWVSLTLSLDAPPGGDPFIDGILMDVTARRELEQSLQEKVEELARSNTDLEQFAYTASHELQEPLRTVERYTKLLSEEAGPMMRGEAKESMEFILEGARRMHRLVDDLLSYSRVVTRSHPFEPVDCERVLDQSLSNLKALSEESRATITRDALPTLNGDSVQLTSVFQNLIGNALKFRNCHPPQVHVSAERKKGEWLFTVRDNGIGFNTSQSERIFGIFQRLHTEAEYPGTGVGLAVCKRIVERHAGRIWAESEPGKGSTFYFTIPDLSPEKDKNPAELANA